ncbi:hypothetical protein EI427_11445 [Flammeovirga pectinis]|uniref:Uncharacterized protein n=1 Tax=Flammeovirga pectinis TaxID=2494373 RepID=A0A3S9P3Q0_9BACT|nr:hypothetical protein [Flammeovirga pectinis]AZQ62825.1 hypothetical protein EI427_11445 [Flammeovirga pectinis]
MKNRLLYNCILEENYTLSNGESTFSFNPKGDLIINYALSDGRPLPYRPNGYKWEKNFTRTRFLNPINNKYSQAKNSGSHLFINGLLYYISNNTDNVNSFSDLKDIYIVEGEKKSYYLNLLGIPSVAFGGLETTQAFLNGNKIKRSKLNSLITEAEENREAPVEGIEELLHEELLELTSKCTNLKRITLLQDADCRYKNDIFRADDNKHLGFLKAIINFTKAVSRIKNSKGQLIEPFYINHEPLHDIGKGIDDCLENLGRTKQDKLLRCLKNKRNYYSKIFNKETFDYDFNSSDNGEPLINVFHLWSTSFKYISDYFTIENPLTKTEAIDNAIENGLKESELRTVFKRNLGFNDDVDLNKINSNNTSKDFDIVTPYIRVEAFSTFSHVPKVIHTVVANKCLINKSSSGQFHSILHQTKVSTSEIEEFIIEASKKLWKINFMLSTEEDLKQNIYDISSLIFIEAIERNLIINYTDVIDLVSMIDFSKVKKATIKYYQLNSERIIPLHIIGGIAQRSKRLYNNDFNTEDYADFILEGMTVEEMAYNTGKSSKTIKSDIKTIFGYDYTKTDATQIKIYNYCQIYIEQAMLNGYSEEEAFKNIDKKNVAECINISYASIKRNWEGSKTEKAIYSNCLYIAFSKNEPSNKKVLSEDNITKSLSLQYSFYTDEIKDNPEFYMNRAKSDKEPFKEVTMSEIPMYSKSTNTKEVRTEDVDTKNIHFNDLERGKGFNFCNGAI